MFVEVMLHASLFVAAQAPAPLEKPLPLEAVLPTDLYLVKARALKATPPKKADALPALLKARLDLAKKAYGESSKAITEVKRAGTNIFVPMAKPEEPYTWSVRWLNAEREMNDKKEQQVAALEAHRSRMKDLQKNVEKMVPGFLPQVDATAAVWYLAEAEVWLAKAK